MKFSAFVLVALTSSASAQFLQSNILPDNFIEQCCGKAFLTARGGLEADYLPPVNLRAGRVGINGKKSPQCYPDGTVPAQCATLDDLCRFWTFPGGDEGAGIETGVMQDLASVPGPPGDDPQYRDFVFTQGLWCCPIEAGPLCTDPKDLPWGCADYIGWTRPTNRGPVLTDDGYYCGLQLRCKEGIVCGEPHFQTWNGTWFDFQGECDINFIEVPEFGKGLGLTIHIRTKGRYDYSFVEAAALKIGDDVLEVASWGEYFFNGIEGADLEEAKFADTYRIKHEVPDEKTHVYTVYTGTKTKGKAEAIQIRTFKDLVAVKIENGYDSTFGASKGMMGDYDEGRMLARDGKTIISDAVEFGMEWQVRAEEPQLFQTPSTVTGQCIMPNKNAAAERRRLGQTVSLEEANAACEVVDTVHHENCVNDVMATGDVEIAHASVF